MSKRFALGCGLILLLFVVVIAGQLTTNQPQVRVLVDHPDAEPAKPDSQKRRIVIIGSHPEDPLFCCGGLIAKLTKSGHEVIVACVASGRRNRKIGLEKDSDIRRREAEAAAKLLGTKSYLFSYENETLTNDEATSNVIASWFKEIDPDIVVTHWPLDRNSNHHVTSSLVWESYLREQKWNLYFFEGVTYYQTIAFTPDLFLDITDVRDLKKEACLLHQSQNPKAFWTDQDDVQRQRGEECGAQFAEAFVLAEPGLDRPLLPVTFIKKRN